jgi:hypothetical protein
VVGAGFRKGHQFNGSTVPWSEGPHAPGSPDRDEARLEQSESNPRLNKSLSGLRRKNPFLPDEFVIDLFRCESLIELAPAKYPLRNMYKDELVKLVSSKTGLNEEMATLAVDTVIGFLKQKLPPELSGQLESLLSGQESSSGIMGAVKGLFGKKDS